MSGALLLAQVVFAAPPENVDFTITPDAQPAVGQERTFSATATDPDADGLTYEWDFNHGGPFTVEATGQTVSRAFAETGARSVALRVSDGSSAPVIKIKSINVTRALQDPTGTFTFAGAPPANGNTPYVGQTVAFSAGGNDPDGGTVTYEWNFGDGATALGPNVTHAYGTRGAKSVRLTVRDDEGATGGQTQSVAINSLPVADANILNASAEPGQAMNVPLAGQPFAYTGGAVPGAPGSSDAEGAISAYAWDLDNNGSFETGGQNAANAGLPAGPRTVRLQVTDSNGATHVDTLSFRVNSAPLPGFILDPPTPAVNRPVQFSSTSSDPDGDPLTYAWDLDGDSAFGEAGEQGPNPRFAFTSAGNKDVRLRVTDTGGISRTVTRRILVQLSVPNSAYGYGPEFALPGQPVTFNSRSTPSEPGKSITGVEWDFDYDRATDSFTADARGATVQHAFASPGPKVVAMRATEGPNGGYGITVGTVVVNAPPQASFTIAPASPLTGEQATLSSTASDPDGPIAKHEWDLDGDGQFDDAAGPVASARFSVAGRKAIRLQVTDARGARAVSTGELVVRRRPLLNMSGVVVAIEGSVSGRYTMLRRLLVRAPRGAKVTVGCRGRSCFGSGARKSPARRPKAAAKTLVQTSRGRTLRFKAIEGRLAPGVKITVKVTKSGYRGRQTVFTTRAARKPARSDRCLVPGRKASIRCPAS